MYVSRKLPRERLSQEPPITYCGIDMFGPLLVKEGRKEMKRSGFLFTCRSSRAIHIESTNSRSTDAFVQALWRFVPRRGNVLVSRTDNGTNFVWASAELIKAFSEMKHKKINESVLEHGGQWIQWKRNPPTTSNMEGVLRVKICTFNLGSTTKNTWNKSDWWITPNISCWSRNCCQYKTHHHQNLYQMFIVQFHCVQCNYWHWNQGLLCHPQESSRKRTYIVGNSGDVYKT